eukprot:3697525-Ditylum_brightwellii.AAC.1
MDKEKAETNNQKEIIKGRNKDKNKITSEENINTKEVIDNNYKKPPNQHNNKQEEKVQQRGTKKKERTSTKHKS